MLICLNEESEDTDVWVSPQEVQGISTWRTVLNDPGPGERVVVGPAGAHIHLKWGETIEVDVSPREAALKINRALEPLESPTWTAKP